MALEWQWHQLATTLTLMPGLLLWLLCTCPHGHGGSGSGRTPEGDEEGPSSMPIIPENGLCCVCMGTCARALTWTVALGLT